MKKLILALLMLPTTLLAQDYSATGNVFVERNKAGKLMEYYNMNMDLDIKGNFLIVTTHNPLEVKKVPIAKRVDTDGSIDLDLVDNSVRKVVFIFSTGSISFYPVKQDQNIVSFFYDNLLRINK